MEDKENGRGSDCILVVDDDCSCTWTIQVNLEAQGYKVLAAKDGQKAIELAVYEEPDLIVLSIEMPGMDGYEVCRRIREFSTVPIIMLTMFAGPAHRVKGLSIGADQCMTKPFNVRELSARIRAVLRRVEISRQEGCRPIFSE